MQITTPETRLKALHRDARQIFQAAVASVDPETAVRRHITRKDGFLQVASAVFRLDDFQQIFLVGAGKATAPMARAMEDLLADRVTGGAIVVKDGHGMPLKSTTVVEAGHPLPDRRGVAGSEAVLAIADAAGPRDLLICLISGGGSALMTAPAEGISLDDKQDATRRLLACGATIHEINTVRKHLSRIKGGLLARKAYPATIVSLILSDVVGDDLDVIASGPTVPDTSTFAAAGEILQRYGIWESVAPSVRIRLEKGSEGSIEDTPGSEDPIFSNGSQVLVGTNMHALKAAAGAAAELGYQPLILTSKLEGEAREIARMLGAMAKEMVASGHPLAAPACILCGGETTVTLRGNGKGGRCQELALAASLPLKGLRHCLVLAGGTDGNDGPTDAAGAIVDGQTLAMAEAKGMQARDYLDRNDAYHFFQALDDLLITGPTRTNVMDVYMVLAGE
jgi:hydroxypyruvate reductase